MRCLRASHGYSAMCCSYYTKLNGGKGQLFNNLFFFRPCCCSDVLSKK